MGKSNNITSESNDSPDRVNPRRRKRSPRLIDLTHQKFGRLTVMGLSNETEKNGNAKWVCQCDCGNWIVIDGQRLRNGTTRSCGCLRREVTRHQSQTNQAFKAYQGNSDNLKNKDGIFYASLRKSSRNSSGVVGVSFDQHSQKYIARLRFNGRYVLNKAVDTLEEAAELRWMAEQQYFHQDVQN